MVLRAVIPQLNVVTQISQRLCSRLAEITHLGTWSARSHGACRLGAPWMLCVDSSYAPCSLPILPEITGTLNSKYGILTRTPPVLCKCTWASATLLLLSLSLFLGVEEITFRVHLCCLADQLDVELIVIGSLSVPSPTVPMPPTQEQ